METFSVSVNIPAESSVTFILTYEELLQRTLGQYEILTRVKPKQRVKDFQVGNNFPHSVLLKTTNVCRVLGIAQCEEELVS